MRIFSNVAQIFVVLLIYDFLGCSTIDVEIDWNKAPDIVFAEDGIYHARAVAFSPDGSNLLVGADEDIIIWNAKTASKIAVYNGDMPNLNYHIRTVDFLPDGNSFLAAQANEASIWNIANGGRVIRTFSDTGENVCFALSTDGDKVLMGLPNGGAKVFNAETGKLLLTITDTAQNAKVKTVAFSPDGLMCLTGGRFLNRNKTTDNPGYTAGGVKIWDSSTGELVCAFTGHIGDINDAVFSPDNASVLSGSDYGELTLWNATTGEMLKDFEKKQSWSTRIECVAFSPDGSRLLASGEYNNEDGTYAGVKIWNTKTGTMICELTSFTEIVFDATFSPDGQKIATASDDGYVKLWQTNEKSDSN